MPRTRKLSAFATCILTFYMSMLTFTLNAKENPDDEWVHLFNGESLDGWTPKFAGYPLGENYRDTFTVKDGYLTVDYTKWPSFNREFGHLFYKTPYSHYTIRATYRFTDAEMPITEDMNWAFRNNGLMLHSQPPETMELDQSFPVSIEVQLLGGINESPRPTLNLCTPNTDVVMDGKLITEHCIKSVSKTYGGNQWVTVDVEVYGGEYFKHIVDGEVVLEYESPQLSVGDVEKYSKIYGGKNLRSGYISIQAETHPIQFKEIKIKPLKQNKVTSDAKLRMSGAKIPEGMKIELWADETQTKNTGFFTFDDKGRMLVTEIGRIDKGTNDIRRMSKYMSIQDISIETMEDRLSMMKDPKNQGKYPWSGYSKYSDYVKLLEDTNGSGQADKAHVFAGPFNDPLDGLAVGLITRDKDVYLTNIPNLWRLKDTTGDEVADEQEVMHTGFGTRMSFLGHDLHGLVWGPDGRLYFSLGDRGHSVTNKEGQLLHGPNMGGVFRMEADGSNLELIYSGLRNPQELTFDKYGNLFTADNDGDRTDTERVNHIVEGGDSGWRGGHQSIMSFVDKLKLRSFLYTGDPDVPTAWLVNNMSKPRMEEQPAFMLPGIAQLFTGPSGFTYNPSMYWGEEWRDSFFIAHMVGATTRSFVSTYKNIENGASFLTTPVKPIVHGINIPDLDFGPDGRLYVSEFNYGGWKDADQGAIFTISPENASSEYKNKVAKLQTLLVQDYSSLETKRLGDLLSEDHMKIRQRAQFELVKRGSPATTLFKMIAFDSSKDTLARIHSIWGLSQSVFDDVIDKNALNALLPLLKDKNEQVRIQTAKVLGDHKVKFAADALVNALDDSHPQVQMYAAIGVGRIGHAPAVKKLINLIKQNKDKDLWLRHAYVMALKGIDKSKWIDYANNDSTHVRMSVLLALRMLEDNDLAIFLNDSDTDIVAEAAFAIDDKEMLELRPLLAKRLDSSLPSNTAAKRYTHHRMINANYNEGTAQSATRLLDYAASIGLHDRLAAEALAAIEGWHDVNPIDPITGHATKANKQRDEITEIINQHIASVLQSVKDDALVQGMRLAEKYNYSIENDVLLAIAQDSQANARIRAQALNLIVSQGKIDSIKIAEPLLKDNSVFMVSSAFKTIVNTDKDKAQTIASDILRGGGIVAKKAVLGQLSTIENDNLVSLLKGYLSELLAGSLDKRMALEVVNAAKESKSPQILAAVKKYDDSLIGKAPSEVYAVALEGGDAKTGEDIFFNNGAAGCMRCHRVNGVGSAFVGPQLTGVGEQFSKEYLLRALVDPSAEIAIRYGSVTLILKSGETLTGTYMGEDENSISVKNGDTTVYQKADVQEIKRAASGMPPMNLLLSDREIRDVLAYLVSLRKEKLEDVH
ncbi:DUF7133 domain-containing protein [Agaribacter marinus]|uniref:Glucose dehydrogenase n=1 Tax=Agaribacter marinus TaxID=1431249 RepID=A0AA37WJ38_9ALTE|nr:family 16 glycoside hydrolase [Agaribacter marinus]GLR71883.1 glucose dehydrogenase [Agaribacter marinus]